MYSIKQLSTLLLTDNARSLLACAGSCVGAKLQQQLSWLKDRSAEVSEIGYRYGVPVQADRAWEVWRPHQVVKQLTTSGAAWKHVQMEVPTSQTSRVNIRSDNPSSLIIMDNCFVKDGADAVQEHHGRGARKDFVVSTTLQPHRGKHHATAWGSAGYSQELLDSYASNELKFDTEKLHSLGLAIGTLQRYAERTGVQIFIEPSVRELVGNKHCMQYTVVDMRHMGDRVRFYSSAFGMPNNHRAQRPGFRDPSPRLPRLLTDVNDVKRFIAEFFMSGTLCVGHRGCLRTPANYIEYLELEQEHLNHIDRQQFTILSCHPASDGCYPWAERCGIHPVTGEVGVGWLTYPEQYRWNNKPSSTLPGATLESGPLEQDRRWSAGRLDHPVVTLRFQTPREMFQHLTKDLRDNFPNRPFVGMDTEGKDPIAKVGFQIYNTTYILGTVTEYDRQVLNDFLDIIIQIEGILVLDRDDGGQDPAGDAFILGDRRQRLSIVNLYAELTRDGRYMPEDAYPLHVEGAEIRRTRSFPVWSHSLIHMLDAAAPTRYFYVKPKGIHHISARQEMRSRSKDRGGVASGISRWTQRRVPDEMLVYLATDAVVIRNIALSIYRDVDPQQLRHTQADKGPFHYLLSLRHITGVDPSSYCFPPPGYCPPSPTYSPLPSPSALCHLTATESLPEDEEVFEKLIAAVVEDFAREELDRIRRLGPELARSRIHY